MSENGSVIAGNPAQDAGSAPWYAGVQDEGLRGFAELKGWKAPDDALKSYKELETFVGAPKDRLIKLPGQGEAWDSVWEKLGRPGKPDEYGFKPYPEVGFDEKVAATIAEQFHKANITKEQAEKLLPWMIEAAKAGEAETAAAKEAEEKAQFEKKAAEFEAYKAERGERFAQEYALAQRAFKFAGGSEEELVALENALGIKRTLEMMTKFGAMFREDGLAGSPGPVATSPLGAKAQLEALTNDASFRQRLANNDAAAVAQWQNLVRMAAAA